MPILATTTASLSEDDCYPTETSTAQHATELHLSQLLDEWKAGHEFMADNSKA